MAKKAFAVLERIDNDRMIKKETDESFLFLLKNALLMALREQGRLSPMQHRHAEQMLKRQRRARAGKCQQDR